MLRLQLVFWLDTIPEVVTLLITIIINDFKDIPLRALIIVLLFVLALAIYSRSDISPDSGAYRAFMSSLAVLLLFFFFGLFKKLFGLEALFGLVDLIFGL